MIHVHRAERADRLVAALTEVLATPPADPFTPELVAVHAHGIERWLAQELAGRLGTSDGGGDGVCANVEFPSPSRVVGRALAAATGVAVDTDPWSPRRLVWPLLEVVDAHLDEDWLTPLRAHLGGAGPGADPTRRGRRFPAVRHISRLFGRYAVQRPAMIRAWANGDDTDARGAAVDADDVWQPRLWRLVRERLDVPTLAERLEPACEALRDGVAVPGLPSRLALFGLTALPSSYLDVLAALGASREIHLLLLHPSPALWQRVNAHLGTEPAARPLRRDADPTRALPRHPLLASWARDARELQLVVGAVGAVQDDHRTLDPSPPTTLLERLQAAIRDDAAPPGIPVAGGDDRRSSLGANDRSLQVHACHGAPRQVEVLRDAILHLLADDPTLQPRDIVVMCPDIETFAPLVSAVFPTTARADAPDDAGPLGAVRIGGRDRARGGLAALPDLRVRIADRSVRRTNPLLGTVVELLALADGRLAASHVLDLAARDPVRRRFGLDDDALERLESWVVDAGVRWGLDGDHRGDFGLAGLDANTWRAGLDRILLGVAMADADDRLVGGAAPLDDVEGADADLAGRLAELIDRLATVVDSLSDAQPIGDWRVALASGADALTATGEADRWQRRQLQRVLDDVAADAGGRTVPLSLGEIRALLNERLRGRPSRAGHRTGDLTVCSLAPMRSVPHRVVCLLGMDDGAFPRRPHADGDDLIARAPCVGDRDARTEDRQLLLDALLAAGDALVVTYSGHDERTNELRPPAVPIGELLDVVDRTVRTVSGGTARDQIVSDHPLQAYDRRNFGADGTRPWSFEPGAFAAARASSREPRPVPFLGARLDPPDDAGDVVELDALIDFLRHPARAFLRRRLGVFVRGSEAEPPDAIPVELAPLEAYAVGQRLLDARLAGAEVDRWLAAERARGVLPPGSLGDAAIAELAATVDGILEGVSRHADLSAVADHVDVDVTLPDGRTLLGSVAGVRGDVLLGVGFGRLRARQRLAAWTGLLAAATVAPQRQLQAVAIGRSRRRDYLVSVSRITPRTGSREGALQRLAQLVDLYDRGLREPLPLYCATSAAYADAACNGWADPHTAAQREWSSRRGWGEDRDPAHVLCLGGVAPYDEVTAEEPRSDEAGPGWSDDATRFGRYARRLWQPLLALERTEDSG